MRLAFATERLLPGELSNVASFALKPYGRVLCLSAFGFRLIVDVITPRADARHSPR